MPSQMLCLCHYFRTKTSYMPSLNQEEFIIDASSTGCYWCLRTMTGVGPDNYFVALETCKPDRTCYQTSD